MRLTVFVVWCDLLTVVSCAEVFRSLKKSGLKQVEAKDAHELATEGEAVLIDVAESQDYARVSAPTRLSHT